MATTITVHLINAASLSATLQADIQTRIDDHLRDTISRAGGLKATCNVTSATVAWRNDCPTGIPGEDVIIRFRPPPAGGRGFVCSQDSKGTSWATRGLTTWNSSGTRSEVYVPACTGGAVWTGAMLGNLAFHELLHNKTHQNDATMHRNGGLAAASVGDATPLTDANVKLLAPVLDASHTQLCG